MTEAELEGRLAAIEAIAAAGLQVGIRRWYAGAFTAEDENIEVQRFTDKATAGLSSEATAAADAAVRRMFVAARSEPFRRQEP